MPAKSGAAQHIAASNPIALAIVFVEKAQSVCGAAQFIIYLVECTAFLGMCNCISLDITVQHLHRKCNQYNLVDCSVCPVKHQRQECYPIVGPSIALLLIPLQCSALQRDLLQECNPVQDSSIVHCECN